MMQSPYKKWADKFFQGIVIKAVEKINGKNGEQALPYLFKTMLRKQLVSSGKWEAVSVLNTRVSANFVSMGSGLPLKRRDSFQKASGRIIKSGMELWLNEEQISELDLMIAQNMSQADIIATLFQDTPRVISGIYELMERVFLEGLSTGYAEISDASSSSGLAVGMDYGYMDENKFGVSVLWSNAAAKPLDDIRLALQKASIDGNTISNVYMDDVTFENFTKTTQVKEFFAFSVGFHNASIVPVPNLEKINAALKGDNRYRFQITIVNRKIVDEKNGKRTVITPWSEGKVILTTSPDVGILAYAPLAEANRPVSGVSYQTADEYILVSKFRQNRPALAEFTTSQARVVPVICNVEQIYQIDAKVVSA